MLKVKLWKNILGEVKNQVEPQTFSTWFKKTEQFSFVGSTLTVRTTTKFFADWLEQHYKSMLEEIAYNLTENNISLEFIGTPKKSNRTTLKISLTSTEETGMNQRYTFERFIVGNNNNFAYSAAQAIANEPGKIYNPLFIYGGVGLGKTHLMQAIGNHIHNNIRNRKVFYTPSEDFTNSMVYAIQNKKTINFRKRFRNYDVLLIDDIQFLAGKDATQEEFFHTFNTLYNSKKQIILSSDRPPKEIKKLQERLISRFEWGLLVDLKKPNYETKIAILQQKCKEEEIKLKHEIIEFIADNCKHNVRELEGSLIKILAYTSYKDIEPYQLNIEDVKVILLDLISAQTRPITLELIQEEVAKYFQIGKNQIKEPTRKTEIAFPRQIAMFLSVKLISNISLAKIANHYNKKDHSTVIHAKKNVLSKTENDSSLNSKINEIIATIKG